MPDLIIQTRYPQKETCSCGYPYLKRSPNQVRCPRCQAIRRRSRVNERAKKNREIGQ